MNETQLAHFKVKLIEMLQAAHLSDTQMYTVYAQIIDEMKKVGCIIKGDSSST